MSSLKLAGMISGMGQGVQQGLTQMNAGIVQQGVQGALQESSQAFQSEKLQEQMAHADRLQTQKIGAEQADNAANREQTRELSQQKMGTEIALSGINNAARSQDVAATNQMHRDIADKTNALNEKLANIKLKFEGESLTKDKMSIYQKIIADAHQESDRLKIEYNKAMTDKDSVSAQMIKLGIDKADLTIDAYDSALRSLAGVKPVAPTAPAEWKPVRPQKQ